MPHEALDSLLEADKGGIWFLPNHVEPRSVQAAAKRAGFAFFPKDFGHNWDAFEECLTDLEWVDADGYVIYYDHIDGLLNAAPDQFETLVEIVRDAVASWKEDGSAMVVLLSGTKPPKVGKLKDKGED